MTDPTPKPNRRWFQFSLLAFVLVTGICGAWVENHARRERAAIAYIEKLGGYVTYDRTAQSWWRLFFRFPDPVKQVSFTGEGRFGLTRQPIDLSPLADLRSMSELILFHTDATDLSPLARLENLERLTLDNTWVIDLSPLAGLKNLREISLFDERVSDLSPLVGLKNLNYLFIGRCPVSDEQAERLHKALPNCKIIR
ncbi:MAG: hypothetical protein K8T25_17935 [Planctomycetia bacterium]|nr:hypothetical protein [Planctomycetia bacterium]